MFCLRFVLSLQYQSIYAAFAVSKIYADESLIVNTSEKTGGAAVAANRLMDALNNNGVKAKMLVRDKETEDITVVSLPRSLRLQWNFLWERWCVFWHLHFSRQRLWEVDMATSGTDITRLREFQEQMSSISPGSIRACSHSRTSAR